MGNVHARARRRLVLLVDLGLFAIALLVLRRVLAQYHYADLLSAFTRLGTGALAASLLVTVAAYAALVAYDYLSLRLVGRPLPVRRMWLPSFVSFAVSNSAPVAILTGGGLRYRLFGGLGLTAGEAARVTAANTLTYLLGLFTVAGAAFLLVPPRVPPSLPLPAVSLHVVGGIFLAVLAGVFGFAVWGPRAFRFRGRRLELPAPGLLLRQLAVAAADWILSGLALFVLLRAGGPVSYVHLLAAFVLAQIVTQFIPLPGGIGVFEALMLLLRPPGLGVPFVAAALLAYRVSYYLIPLSAAGIALVWRATRRTPPGARPGRGEAVARALVPHVLAVLTFLAGGWLLLFGALPSDPERLRWLGRVFPLGVIEGSHFVGSIVGTGLLLLAWGLERRIREAWRFALLLVLAGIPLVLLRQGDLVGAGLLLLLTVMLVAARHAFERRTPLSRTPVDAGWVAAVGGALVMVVSLGLFAHRHQEYSGELWWRFALEHSAPRALRTAVAVAVTLTGFILGRLVARARWRHASRPGRPAAYDSPPGPLPSGASNSSSSRQV